MSVLEICLIVYIVSTILFLVFVFFMDRQITNDTLISAFIPVQNTIFTALFLTVFLWECLEKLKRAVKGFWRKA